MTAWASAWPRPIPNWPPTLSVAGYTSSTLLTAPASVTRATTDYDDLGRITGTVDYMGFTTTNLYTWDGGLGAVGMATFGGWDEVSTNTSGLSETLKTDIFGRLVTEEDYGGNYYEYLYNPGGDKLSQIDTDHTGDTLSYTDYAYYNSGREATVTNTVVTDPGVTNPNFAGSTVGVTTYGYDWLGDKASESFVQTVVVQITGLPTITTPTTYETETAHYNALGWLTDIQEAGSSATQPMLVAYKYDLNGNIREMTSQFTNLTGNSASNAGAVTNQDYWYKYDAMNRVVLSEGQLSGTQIVRGYQGTDIQYDLAGERISASNTTEDLSDIYNPQDHVHTEYYGYSGDGYLTSVNVADNWVNFTAGGDQTAGQTNLYLAVSKTSDAMGRLTAETDYLSTVELSGQHDIGTSRSMAYDKDSLLTSDTTSQRQSDASYTTSTDDYYYEAASATEATGFVPTITGGVPVLDNAGVYLGGQISAVLTTSYNTKANGGATTTLPTYYYSYSYVWTNQAQQLNIAWDPDVSKTTIYHTAMTYDGNGYLTTAAINDGQPHTVTYVNNAAGEILKRTDSNGPVNEYYYLNGHTIGSLNNVGPDTADYAQSIVQAINGPAGASVSGDFDQNNVALNTGTGPAATGQSYTVQAGDTLQSIAQAAWGDANLWYLIADANGLTASSTLVIGETLALPNDVINVGNNAAVTKPYNAATATGFVLPNHLPPPPPPSHGCGGIGEILVAIVAIAVAAIPGIGPAISGALAHAIFPILAAALPSAGVLATAVVSEVVADALTPFVVGALGDAIGQGVAIAVGAQSGFDWNGLALATLGAGISANLGVGVGKVNFSSPQSIAFTVAKGAAASAITQGIGVAAGLQKQFSWAGVAVGGIEGFAEEAVPELDSGLKLTGFESHALTGTAAAIAGASVNSLITGEDFGHSLYEELPSLAGQTIGSEIGSQIDLFNQPASQNTLPPGSFRLASNAAYDNGTAVGTVGLTQNGQPAQAQGQSTVVDPITVEGAAERAESWLQKNIFDPIEGTFNDISGDLLGSLTEFSNQLGPGVENFTVHAIQYSNNFSKGAERFAEDVVGTVLQNHATAADLNNTFLQPVGGLLASNPLAGLGQGVAQLQGQFTQAYRSGGAGGVLALTAGMIGYSAPGLALATVPGLGEAESIETVSAAEGTGGLSTRFVGDSNLFLDRPVVAGGTNVRGIFDDVLAHPDVNIVVPDLVHAEITPTASQIARLGSTANPIEIANTDISGVLASNPNILSARFGVEDLQLLETARINGVPVVTSNSALINQVASNAARSALYGDVPILVPTQHFSTAQDLVNILRAGGN